MIVGLLHFGLQSKQVGKDYGLNLGMIGRWKKEFKSNSGDFSKQKVLSPETAELKALKKTLRNVTM